MTTAPFASYRGAFQPGWLFAGAEDTAARLARIGFVDVVTSVEAAPAEFDGPEAFQTFVDHVCLRPYFNVLPDSLRQPFSDELVRQAESDLPAFTLDYWRLNIAGTRKPS
jgi:hypothetical protein